MSYPGLVDIARAIDGLARAQQAEADATAALVAQRREEIAAAKANAEARLAADWLDRASIERLESWIADLAPALELLTTIAETMRGKR